jgi:hypothetical protein
MVFTLCTTVSTQAVIPLNRSLPKMFILMNCCTLILLSLGSLSNVIALNYFYCIFLPFQ